MDKTFFHVVKYITDRGINVINWKTVEEINMMGETIVLSVRRMEKWVKQGYFSEANETKEYEKDFLQVAHIPWCDITSKNEIIVARYHDYRITFKGLWHYLSQEKAHAQIS